MTSFLKNNRFDSFVLAIKAFFTKTLFQEYFLNRDTGFRDWLFQFKLMLLSYAVIASTLYWFPDAQSGIAAYSLSIFLLCLIYLGYLARHFSIDGGHDSP